MKRRYAVVSLAVAFTAILAGTIIRCDLPTAYTSFSYIPRERPRVFVSHHPIRALPGQTVTIRLTPDLRPQDGTPQRAVARIGLASTDARDEPTCVDSGGGIFDCVFTLPAGNNDFIYDGFVVLSDGTEVHSRTAYRFRAASTISADELLTLREPVKPQTGLGDNYRVGTVWVHDDGDGYSASTFLADIESAVYSGILADPVYRWRDTQLAFYQYGSPGLTTSYYSGFDTRCGQNPWPGEPAFRAALNGVDVVGVLHRHPNTAGGVEGTVTSTNVFRDCAGTAVKNTSLRAFSATGSLAMVAKHEYGHAAFGFGDEYTESEATRRVDAAPSRPDSECCCMPPDDGTTTGTGTGTGVGGGVTGAGTGVVVPGGATPGTVVVPGTAGGTGTVVTVTPRIRIPRCLGEGGVPRAPRGGAIGLPTCSDTQPIPATCGATPQAVCPTLVGDCVQARMWLGQPAPPGSNPFTPNMFTSQADCEAGRTAALGHPGVEDRAQSVDAVCHQLCGGSLPACPCGQTEGWIVDRNPAASSSAPGTNTDTMATALAPRLGGTCARCVETTLCVRWQRGRGQSASEAWSYCEAPPLDAADNERATVTLMQAIAAYIRELTRGWLF
jgi:hypothetical protein